MGHVCAAETVRHEDHLYSTFFRTEAAQMKLFLRCTTAGGICCIGFESGSVLRITGQSLKGVSQSFDTDMVCSLPSLPTFKRRLKATMLSTRTLSNSIVDTRHVSLLSAARESSVCNIGHLIT